MRNPFPLHGAGKTRVAHQMVSQYLEELGSSSTPAGKLLVDPEVFIDPMGDSDLQQGLVFYTHGQTAYGEWLKKLSAQDRAPRGKCAAFFAKHQQLRDTPGKGFVKQLIKANQQRLARHAKKA